MFVFIDVVKTIATILITNSHYSSIWPIPFLAMGGLLGDLLFFMVSGFCLYHIKESFQTWYLRRIIRVYPAVIIAGVVILLLGLKNIDGSFQSIIKYFVYPTIHHFIASIMLLYVFFYILTYLHHRNIVKYEYSMLAIALIALFIYIFFYDKSHYHVDNVDESYIRFIFMEAMLIGAKLRQILDEKPEFIANKQFGGGVFCMSIVYFLSKVVFLKIPSISKLQIINQFVIMIYTCYIFCFFMKRHLAFELMQSWQKKTFNTIASLTLDIYVVQIALISILPKVPFPISLITTAIAIFCVAWILHLLSSLITNGLNKILSEKRHETEEI